jgi:hypothetical protein
MHDGELFRTHDQVQGQEQLAAPPPPPPHTFYKEQQCYEKKQNFITALREYFLCFISHHVFAPYFDIENLSNK